MLLLLRLVFLRLVRVESTMNLLRLLLILVLLILFGGLLIVMFVRPKLFCLVALRVKRMSCVLLL